MPDGVVPVLVTPMREGGEPDPEGTSALVEHLLHAGVGGMWLLGSTGEDAQLSWERRIHAIRLVVEAVGGRVPVITGTGCGNVDDVLRFLDKLNGMRLDGVHFVNPDTKLSDQRYAAEITRLAERSRYSVWLYSNPYRGKQVSGPVLQDLHRHPRIDGIKVGGYELSRMIESMLYDGPDFQVVGAGGGQMFSMLCLGASAHTTSDSCCWPEEYVELVRLFRQGDLNAAREQQFRLVRLTKSLPRGAFRDNGEFAAEEKYILSLQGICMEHVNPAYRTLTQEEKSQTRAALRSFGFPWCP